MKEKSAMHFEQGSFFLPKNTFLGYIEPEVHREGLRTWADKLRKLKTILLPVSTLASFFLLVFIEVMVSRW